MTDRADARSNEQQHKNRHRLFLWCLPRSGSTALTKCLSFLDPDTEVWFEPYLVSRDIRRLVKHELGLDLPLDYTGNEKVYDEVIARRNLEMHGTPLNTIKDHRLISYEGLKHRLEASTKSTVIVKDLCMAHEGIDFYLPNGFRYVFLIRNPYHMFISFHKMLHSFAGTAVAGMDFEDIYAPFYPELHFYGELCKIWKHLQATGVETNPLIIDFEDLLSNPAPYIKRICEVMGAEYSDKILEWDTSMDVIREKWINGWMEMYLSDKVAESTTFKRAFTCSRFHPLPRPKPVPDRSTIPADVLRIVDNVLDYYDEMYEHRFIPQTT